MISRREQTISGPALFQSDYGPVREYCNIWRNFWDVSDKFDSIKGIVEQYDKNNALYQKYTGPGGFFDPDMLVVGGFGLSHYQQKLQMAMWSMWAAPLIMSNDLRNIPQDARNLLLNKYIIAVNQDPLGVMATKLWEFNGLAVWIKPLATPKGSLAVAVINMGVSPSGIPISSPASSFGLNNPNGYNVTDVFTGKSMGIVKPDDTITTRVFPYDVFMLVCYVKG